MECWNGMVEWIGGIEWNGGMEWWNGTLEWNSKMVVSHLSCLHTVPLGNI